MIENALKIDGWMSEAELSWLAAKASTAEVIVEVGSWKGRSTRALADSTLGVVYAIDHWRGAPEIHHFIADQPESWLYETFRANLQPHIDNKRVRPIVADSLTGIAQLSIWKVYPDFVFLDGSHYYMDVLREINQFMRMIPAGGILAGHDYGEMAFAGVSAAVNETFFGPITGTTLVQRGPGSIWWVEL